MYAFAIDKCFCDGGDYRFEPMGEEIVAGEEDDSMVESMMTSGTEDTVERESIGGGGFSFNKNILIYFPTWILKASYV